MPRDERTTTAVSSATPLTNQQRIPGEVHQQLTHDFLPAVKEVATTGEALLKNFQDIERSSEAYARALESLARSAKSADKKAHDYGKELHELLKEYTKVIGYHKDCTRELSAIVKKTNKYSNEEKAKLKEDFSKHQKKEKDLLKEQKKGTKSNAEVEQFYDESAREFMRQQEMRYKFFLDKHKKWFNKYWELLEKIQSDRAPASNGAVAEVTPVQPNGGEVHRENETPIIGNGVGPDEELHIDVTPEVHVAQEAPKLQNGDNDDPPFLHSGNSSPRSSISSMSRLPSRRPTNELIPGVTLIKEQKRLSINRFEEAAVAQRNGAVQTDPAPPVVNEISVSPPVPVRREERRELSPHRVSEQPQQIQTKKYEYHGPIIVPAPVPRTREPEAVRQPRETPMMIPRTVDAPVYVRPHSESRASFIPPPERPHYHVESEYNPAVSPAHRPSVNYNRQSNDAVVVPSMFNASDYGRTLTVAQDFNATSGEQITVNRGDRVILIKSGSRGWIFIQDQSTQRTGWIPAPYVGY